MQSLKICLEITSLYYRAIFIPDVNKGENGERCDFFNFFVLKYIYKK